MEDDFGDKYCDTDYQNGDFGALDGDFGDKYRDNDYQNGDFGDKYLNNDALEEHFDNQNRHFGNQNWLPEHKLLQGLDSNREFS